MRLLVGPKANINYLAKIVKIENFKPHTDPEVTKLKCCVVDGFNIICGMDSQPGLYVYFPTACCLNPDFLRYANLYRKKELNNNPDETGMFEENGRAHFMTKRFDRVGGSERIHTQTMCAINHMDFNRNQSYSYEQLFQIMRRYSLELRRLSQREVLRRRIAVSSLPQPL